MDKMEQAKRIKFRTKYQNKWVALKKNSNGVIASNASLQILVKNLSKTKEDYILEKVLPPNIVFIP